MGLYKGCFGGLWVDGFVLGWDVYNLVWVAGILGLLGLFARGGKGICFVSLLGLVFHWL